ncbi:MAG: hypothetical protein FJ010_09165, partial [Chloroflexi bacterium]|nr:hypothetical protein [Chloroflexota bacterium]
TQHAPTVNETNQFIAIPYGPSRTAPEDDVREFELYFERLEAAAHIPHLKIAAPQNYFCPARFCHRQPKVEQDGARKNSC